MSDPKRTWREIARELAREENPLRCTELSVELTQAIKEEERQNRIAFISAARGQKQQSFPEQPKHHSEA